MSYFNAGSVDSALEQHTVSPLDFSSSDPAERKHRDLTFLGRVHVIDRHGSTNTK
jgi:hypothetical protein